MIQPIKSEKKVQENPASSPSLSPSIPRPPFSKRKRKRSLTRKIVNLDLERSEEKEDQEDSKYCNDNRDNEEILINDSFFTIIAQFNLKECCKCAKTFMTNSEYLNHFWKAHLSNKSSENRPKFECWPCHLSGKQNASFSSEAELIKHLKSLHLNELPYKCSICDDCYFTDLALAQSHYKNMHFQSDSSSMACYFDDTDQEFVDVAKQTDNVAKTDRNKFVFACANCEQMFQSHQKVVDHFIHSSECNLNSKINSVKNLEYVCFFIISSKFKNEKIK